MPHHRAVGQACPPGQELLAARLAGVIGQQRGAGDGVECGVPDAGPLAQQRVQGPERAAFPEQGMTQADTPVAEMVDTPQQGTHGGFHIRVVHGRRCCGACGQGLHVDGLRSGLVRRRGRQEGAYGLAHGGLALQEAGQQLIKGRGVRLAAALAVFAAAAPLHAAAVQGAASAASHAFTGAAAFTAAQPLAEGLQKAAAGQSLACHAQQAHAEFRPEHVCRSFAPPLYGIMPPAPVCVVGPEISVMSGLFCHARSRARHADG